MGFGKKMSWFYSWIFLDFSTIIDVSYKMNGADSFGSKVISADGFCSKFVSSNDFGWTFIISIKKMTIQKTSILK